MADDLAYDSADFALAWPTELFVREAKALLANHRRLHDSEELLLTEAFAGPAPHEALREADAWAPWPKSSSQSDFLIDLVRNAGLLRQASVRSPYWSQRRRGTVPSTLDLHAVAKEFVRLVGDLRSRGYLHRAFPQICVDDRDSVETDPSETLEGMLGVDSLWPLNAARLAGDQDLLCDVMECLHDLVARPRSRSYHDYASCGWHYENFAPEPGRILYRWRVNQLLDRSELGLRLADEGEDIGRLIAVVDDARSELERVTATRGDGSTGDRVRHALALFRARGATEHDKRSAVIVLAGILEERREVVRQHVGRKDEGALFQIANEFAIRHQRDGQKGDFDESFLDWIYWWYLATVELTDRIIARQTGSA